MKDACLEQTATSWALEVETLDEEFKGERWEPRLYHQGLKFEAVQASDLQGKRTHWSDPKCLSYPHPELGLMYVFGHEPVYDSALFFGTIDGNEISVHWSGLCDVLWDDEFGSALPFVLECKAKIVPAQERQL